MQQTDMLAFYGDLRLLYASLGCVKTYPTTVSPNLVNNHLTAEQKPYKVYSAEAPLAI